MILVLLSLIYARILTLPDHKLVSLANGLLILWFTVMVIVLLVQFIPLFGYNISPFIPIIWLYSICYFSIFPVIILDYYFELLNVVRDYQELVNLQWVYLKCVILLRLRFLWFRDIDCTFCCSKALLAILGGSTHEDKPESCSTGACLELGIHVAVIAHTLRDYFGSKNLWFLPYLWKLRESLFYCNCLQ